MRKRNYHRTILCLIAAWGTHCGAAATMADGGPEKFPHPDRLRFDGQCFTINGKDTFIFSGAFHYFRCPKPLWPERFRRIKEAGFNAVETYVAWNWHEREPPAGLSDLSKVDLSDLDDWLKMAEDEFGLYTIVRPGPYICAEWAGGGFPHWLILKKPVDTKSKPWIRSDDPVFLAWSRHWYDAVCPVIARHQITRRPAGKVGVILMQIENEYDYMNQPDEVKANHLRALAKDAWDNGIEVPLFTCWSKQVRGSRDPVLCRVIDGCNEYVGWKVDRIRGDLQALRRTQPDAPMMIPELQGGWFTELGGLLAEDQDGITPAQTNNLTLFAMQNGVTALNYYMLFGGTNFGDWPDDVNTTTYDYNAAIRECGGVGEKYRVVQAIGAMLRDHGLSLARSRLLEWKVDGAPADLDVAIRRAADGSRFVFFRNHSRTKPLEGKLHVADEPAIDVAYDLAPFGAKVLYLPSGAKEGEWFPKLRPAPKPIDVPVAVRIASAAMRLDDGKSRWQPIRMGEPLAAHGIFDCRFVLYRTRFRPVADNAENLKCVWVKPISRSDVAVTLNGRTLKRVGTLAGQSLFEFDALKRNEVNELVILYENPGYSKWGEAIEDMKGLADVRVIPQRAPDRVLDHWKVKRVTSTQPSEADRNDSAWRDVTLTPGSCPGPTNEENAICALRTSLRADELLGGLHLLEFGCIDDHGWIYVNDARVGESHDWSKPAVFDINPRLSRPGDNLVTVMLKNDHGPGGLTQPVRLMADVPDGKPLEWEFSPQLSGVDAGWFKEKVDESGWTSVALDTRRSLPHKHAARDVDQLPSPASGPISDSTSSPAPLATWYRLIFELPATPGKWVPWRIALDASGNGFVYLNGHALGRYWEIGPQREYYLPECWLNVGPGKSNVLSLCLRPTEHGAALRAAEVAPYAEFAEKRQ